jgi:hypothetical protein
LALGNDGGFEAGTKIVRQFVEFGVAVNLNGLLGGVAYYIAVVAPSQMVLKLCLRSVVDDAV